MRGKPARMSAKWKRDHQPIRAKTIRSKPEFKTVVLPERKLETGAVICERVERTFNLATYAGRRMCKKAEEWLKREDELWNETEEQMFPKRIIKEAGL